VEPIVAGEPVTTKLMKREPADRKAGCSVKWRTNSEAPNLACCRNAATFRMDTLHFAQQHDWERKTALEAGDLAARGLITRLLGPHPHPSRIASAVGALFRAIGAGNTLSPLVAQGYSVVAPRIRNYRGAGIIIMVGISRPRSHHDEFNSGSNDLGSYKRPPSVRQTNTSGSFTFKTRA